MNISQRQHLENPQKVPLELHYILQDRWKSQQLCEEDSVLLLGTYPFTLKESYNLLEKEKALKKF